ncbi:hypothetical protein TEA_023508 [Camellia sinensis var. sinensis]|uniref:QLQ domain-containing protein n=1 Tax=Camellia sinensis var. sinensis TaxID=542762 RepID=A0A4S4DZU5_CAMSN|nr:hypothetical protein TEA_023508 [Camellia sinensis var. sinensis]
MQSGGGGGAAGHGRNPAVVGPTSSSASPSSSSSATPHLGFDSIQQQQQKQQQQQQRQSFQQQLHRKPEGNESIRVYQAGALHGVLPGGNFSSSPNVMQLPQQSRNFIDLAQPHGVAHIREEGQNRSQGIEQVLNPVHQSYLQYPFQAAQQKSAPGIQSQMQAKMGMMGPLSGKDQDTRMGNLQLQELMSIQAANQAQASSSSKKPSEYFARAEKHTQQVQQAVSDQRSDSKPPIQPTSMGQLVQANVVRPMHAPKSQQSIQNMANNQLAMVAQALVRERNFDLSLPANADLMAQLIPLMQPRVLAQQKANENNMGAQSSSPVSMPKQQVASPQVASESSPHGNSSSDVSGQLGPSKARQIVAPGPFGTTSNAATLNNANNVLVQQFPAHGRENHAPPRQTMMVGNGVPPMHPPQSSVNLNQGMDNSSHTKSSLTGAEALQMQYARQLNRSSPQPAASSIDGGLGNPISAQGGMVPQIQHRTGFTKQQLHVLKVQILAFRRIKKGEATLPQELLQAIAPPPLDMQLQLLPTGITNQDRPTGKYAEDRARQSEFGKKDPQEIPSHVQRGFRTCRNGPPYVRFP